MSSRCGGTIHCVSQELFKDLGIPVSTSGRLLGGVVGDTQGAMSFVSGKVNNWSDHIHKLPSIALTQPQAAYIALIKSLQCEWIYLQRVTPDSGSLFSNFENAICDHFLPALFAHLTKDYYTLYHYVLAV